MTFLGYCIAFVVGALALWYFFGNALIAVAVVLLFLNLVRAAR